MYFREVVEAMNEKAAELSEQNAELENQRTILAKEKRINEELMKKVKKEKQDKKEWARLSCIAAIITTASALFLGGIIVGRLLAFASVFGY